MSILIKRGLTVGILLIPVNLFMNFFLVPYVQETANKHMIESDLVVITIILISVILLIIGGKGLYKRKMTTFSYFMVIGGINLILWIPVILNIECTHCSMGG